MPSATVLALSKSVTPAIPNLSSNVVNVPTETPCLFSISINFSLRDLL
jgi:hypothetical protein